MSAVRPAPDAEHVEPDVVETAWGMADALAPLCRQIEERAVAPRAALPALVRVMGEAGLLRLVARSRDGGAFERVRTEALCLARERLGVESPLADLAFAMQGLGSYPITLGGDEAARARHLPGVLRGEAVAAFALTEPEAGTDVASMRTTATRDGDAYVLDGRKTFISNAGLAHVITVFAVTAPDADRRRVSAFVLPGDAPGLRAEPQEVLGGHPIGELHLDGVRVPAVDRLGDEGDGMRLALGTLARFRPTVGAAAVGFAQRALDESLAHVRGRRQFGDALAALPAVQARLSDMACDVDAARLLVRRAAAVADRPDADRGEAARTGSMAKLVATEAAQRVVDSAVQLFGGRGVLRASVVARLYEDVRSLRIYEGVNDVHKTIIARELLRRP